MPTTPLLLSLDEHEAAFIEAQVKSGVFKSAGEVVHAGLQLLESEEGRLAELRQMILEGMQQIERGGCVTFSGTGDLTAYIIAQAKAKT